LTGRHGLLNCYEAFIHIVDSMFNQHAKWLKVTAGLAWRRKIASLNYLLMHVWRQDHNGFTHQDPGSRHVATRRRRSCGVLAADANCLAVRDGPLPAQPPLRQCGRGGQNIRAPNGCRWDAAVKHCSEGIGIWQWASNDQRSEPDLFWPARAMCRRSRVSRRCPSCASICPSSRSPGECRRSHEAAADLGAPAGLSDSDFDALFTTNKPVIFAFQPRR